jgi:hypothetical protein
MYGLLPKESLKNCYFRWLFRTFSSKQIPLKITFLKKKNTLMTQATGQSPFPGAGIDK